MGLARSARFWISHRILKLDRCFCDHPCTRGSLIHEFASVAHVFKLLGFGSVQPAVFATYLRNSRISRDVCMQRLWNLMENDSLFSFRPGRLHACGVCYPEGCTRRVCAHQHGLAPEIEFYPYFTRMKSGLLCVCTVGLNRSGIGSFGIRYMRPQLRAAAGLLGAGSHSCDQAFSL